jgi:hypothetical protein
METSATRFGHEYKRSILPFHPYPRTRLVVAPQPDSRANHKRYRDGVLRSRPVGCLAWGKRLIELLLPVHLLIPGPLLTVPHHRVCNYTITCTINLANVCPSDCPIFAGVNDTPCAPVYSTPSAPEHARVRPYVHGRDAGAEITTHHPEPRYHQGGPWGIGPSVRHGGASFGENLPGSTAGVCVGTLRKGALASGGRNECMQTLTL